MKSIFYIVKKKTNKKGCAPIYCRITVNGIRSEFSTGFFIVPSLWKSEQVSATTAENIAINTSLTKIKSEINLIYHDLVNRNHAVTSLKLKNIFLGENKISYTFLEMFEEFFNHKCHSTKKYNTIKTYKSRKALIYEYLIEKKLSNIMPDEFDILTAERFLQHTINIKKLKRNYVNRVITFIKEGFNYGVKAKIINVSPLAAIRLKHEKPKPIVALDKVELLKLTTYKFYSERLQQIADCYVFQSFTGFAYADLNDFNFDIDVQTIKGKKWIVKNRFKSGIEAVIPLFADALRILKKYKFKLPVVSNQKYNTYLKEVADILGFKKHLTTHTARKTFGMVKLNDGFSLETVSKMLGHVILKTTQTSYASVDMSRISDEQKTLRIK